MWKLFVSSAAVIVVAAVLAGCPGGGNKTTSSSSGGGNTPVTADGNCGSQLSNVDLAGELDTTLDRCIDDTMMRGDVVMLSLPGPAVWTLTPDDTELGYGFQFDQFVRQDCESYSVAANGQYALRDGGTTDNLKLYMPVISGPAQVELFVTEKQKLGGAHSYKLKLHAEPMSAMGSNQPVLGPDDEEAQQDFFSGFVKSSANSESLEFSSVRTFSLPVTAAQEQVTLTVDQLPGRPVRLLLSYLNSSLRDMPVGSPGVMPQVTLPGPNTYQLEADLEGGADTGSCPFGGWMAEPPANAVLPLKLHADHAAVNTP